LAKRHGYTDDQIQSLSQFESRADFSEKEKIALRFAEKMTKGDGHVEEALWKQVRGAFDEGEVVELAGAIGLFNYFNRFNNALEMEPTK
jgi:alkylhydroperoxidase family enzyme